MKLVSLAFLAFLAAACASRHASPCLARVNDERITGDVLRREFARHHMALDKIIGDEKEIRRYLEKVIDRRLLVQEARRMGLPERSDIRAMVNAFRAEKMRQLLIRDEVDEKAKAKDEEVKAVYVQYDETLEIRQMVVEKEEEAEEIRAKLAGGADMESIVRARSLAPSARNGGLSMMGWGGDVSRERAVFALRPGELTAPYRSDLGWEIDRIEKRTKIEKRPSLEKLASRIRATIERRRRAELLPRLMDEVRRKHEARALDCPVSAGELRKALEGKPDGKALRETTCASWRGGALTFADVAARVVLDEVEQVLPERQEEVGRQIVRDLLDEQVLGVEAEVRGYGQAPEIVEQVQTKEDDLVEERLLGEFMLKGVEATPDEIRAYYDAHRTEFVEPARFLLAQIVVPTPELAKEVQGKLAANEPFEDLAREYSRDRRTADQGGLVGELRKDMLEEQFATVLALHSGEVSPPIKSDNGYHLVKLVSSDAERQLSFDEAKDRVRFAVLKPKVDVRSTKWLGQLRGAARITVSDAGIRAYARQKLKALERGSSRGSGPHSSPTAK